MSSEDPEDQKNPNKPTVAGIVGRRSRRMDAVGPPTTSSPYLAPKSIGIQRVGRDVVVVVLRGKRIFTLGRSFDADIVFPDDSVSGLHASLQRTDSGRWALRDLGSRNGTWVDGQQISSGSTVEVQADQVIHLAKPEKGNFVRLLADRPPDDFPATPAFKSKASLDLIEFMTTSAFHRSPIVLLGATGAGKNYIAREIHDLSHVDDPFVYINCAALPTDRNTLHSELIGHVKGAYTGADYDRTGKLLDVGEGTLFLDEVDSMPSVAQDFLLDALDRPEGVVRLGASERTRRPLGKFRFISATKVPLAKSRLRKDLVQRLAVGAFMRVPTLKERQEDIPVFVELFRQEIAAATDVDAAFTPDALQRLRAWEGPGNLRTLRGAVEDLVSEASAAARMKGNPTDHVKVDLPLLERYLSRRAEVVGDDDEVTPTHGIALPTFNKRPEELTETDIREALARNNGNKTHAANALGVVVNTLKKHMKKWNIEG